MEPGIETSVNVPAASSARLHMAIACTVPMWLVTLRRFFIETRASPARNSSKRGADAGEVRRLEAYGAREQRLAEGLGLELVPRR